MTMEVPGPQLTDNDEAKRAGLQAEREKLAGLMPDSEAAEAEAEATRAVNEKIQYPDFGTEDKEERTLDRQIAALAKGAIAE